MPTAVDTHVGDQLRRLRKERGLTQSDLAEQLGISFQQVQKYEVAANRISASVLAKVVTILDVPIGAVFPQELRGVELAPEELEVLSGFRALDDVRRSQLLSYLRKCAIL